ncbi:MAG: hypothetical protein ABWW66_05520 [Archaeoglobaceae archaeon]
MEKLKSLIEHWIEHNREHVARYLEWAERIEAEKPEVAELLRKAADKFKEGEELLEEAAKRV